MTAYQYTPWLWPLLGSAVLLGAIATYLWRRRRTPGARPLALASYSMALVAVGSAGERAATAFATQVGWFFVQQTLTLLAALLALWFALEYAGLRRWLTRPLVAGLVASMAVYVAAILFDDGRLLWSRLWWDDGVRGSPGALGLAFNAYGLGIALAATAALVLLFARSPAHRIPVALIVTAQFTVRAAYIAGTFDLAGLGGTHILVLALDVAAVLYVIAFTRFRLFDLVPVAREMILARMSDGLIVVDARDRIADLNAAAQRLLQLRRGTVLRQPVATALASLPDVVRAMTSTDGASAEASIDVRGEQRWCELSSVPLADWQGNPIGRLVQLHDTTAIRRVEGQLVEHERAIAAIGERERLAREIHDGLAQDLWLAKLRAGRLAALSGLGTEGAALIEELEGSIDAALAEAREAVAALRLADHGGPLPELIARALEDFEDRFGLAVEFELASDLDGLPPRAGSEILRILHESLTNIRRHADATVVRVTAGADDGRFELVMTDNGRGFDPDRVGDTAYGLAGMRERAALIGGELSIQSAPGEGTRVSLLVPLPDRAAVAAGMP